EVAEYASRVSYDSIPADVIKRAKEALIDGLGVMLAGCGSESGDVMGRYMHDLGVSGKSSVIGKGMMLPAQFAALANGTAGHALDYDDTQISSVPDRVYGLLTHPTVPVLAASLAVAEEVGAGGKDLVTAFCAGVEVACKVAEAINPQLYKEWASLAQLRLPRGFRACRRRMLATP
ncbi:MAG: MmgE/PrpD family protein, partial [Dehalococcoidia bacterium]|nr:MmgE/PrpD family protein [Dehalococcoidia bacterium]